MAMTPRPFHLAAISLVLLALLPANTAAEASTSTSLSQRASSALPMRSPRDAPPSAATGRLHATPAPRRQEDTAAPSPEAAPPTTRPEHRARAVDRPWYAHYDVTLADLRSVCQAPRCFVDSDDLLLSVLYGPHIRIRSGNHRYGYGVARTIEGTQPVLPPSAWRADVYSGGDVCHVELGYMDLGTFLGADCPDWTCQRHFTQWPDEAFAWALSAIATPCGGGGTSSAASPRNAMVVALLPLLAATAFLPPPLAAAVALTSLATRALATDEEYYYYMKLNHATCAVNAYDNATGEADCDRPLCIDAAGVEEHRDLRGDPLRIYCTVAGGRPCGSTAD